MNLCIIKRNGDIKPFDKEKIILAISKAYHGEDIPDYVYAIADKIEAMAVESEDYLSVEEIQDKVENLLMEFDKETAREYIRYRFQRETVRKNSVK